MDAIGDVFGERGAPSRLRPTCTMPCPTRCCAGSSSTAADWRPRPSTPCPSSCRTSPSSTLPNARRCNWWSRAQSSISPNGSRTRGQRQFHGGGLPGGAAGSGPTHLAAADRRDGPRGDGVFEKWLPLLARNDEQLRALTEAVLRYGREIGFAAATIYASAAESRGAWDPVLRR